MSWASASVSLASKPYLLQHIPESKIKEKNKPDVYDNYHPHHHHVQASKLFFNEESWPSFRRIWTVWFFQKHCSCRRSVTLVSEESELCFFPVEPLQLLQHFLVPTAIESMGKPQNRERKHLICHRFQHFISMKKLQSTWWKKKQKQNRTQLAGHCDAHVFFFIWFAEMVWGYFFFSALWLTRMAEPNAPRPTCSMISYCSILDSIAAADPSLQIPNPLQPIQ
jgi:hypothetical protein